MTAPALKQYSQGNSVVSADNLNSFTQTCNTYADLRAFIGTTGIQVGVRGGATIGDQYAGEFYWVSGSTADDNNVTIIAPTGAPTGRWIRVSYYSQNANSSLVINVQDFGATGDGVTDDSAAINAAFAYARAQLTAAGVLSYNYIIYFPPGTYVVLTTINATFIGPLQWGIRGPGKILGKTAGQPVLDLTNSRWCHIEDLFIYGSQTASETPNIGILVARAIRPDLAILWFCDVMLFENVVCAGNFTTAAVYNYASEDTCFVKCQFFNSHTGTSSYCVAQDGSNSFGITSPYQNIPAATPSSFNNNTFIAVEFRKDSGGPALFLRRTDGHRFINCYTVSINDAAVVVSADASNVTSDLHLGVHVETSGATSSVRFQGSATMTILGFEYVDMGPQASLQTLEAGSGVTLVTINDININIPRYNVTPSNGLYSDQSKFTITSGRIQTPLPQYNRGYNDQHPGWATGRFYFFACGTTEGGFVGVENRLYFFPLIVPRSQAIDRLGFVLTSGAGNVSAQAKVGIYKNGRGAPISLLFDGGFLTIGTSTGQFLATVSQTLPDGPLWLAVILNSNGGTFGTPTFRNYDGNSVANLANGIFGNTDLDISASGTCGAFADVTVPSWPSFVLPTTAPTISYTLFAPLLGVRAA